MMTWTIVPTDDGAPSAGASFTVLFIDDNEPLIEALDSRLQLEVGFAAMYRAIPLTDAAQAVTRLRPDIVLLDVNLPDGIEMLQLLQAIVRDAPASRVIIFTGHPNGQLVTQTMGLGAWGFVSKGVSTDRLISAIHRVRRGEAVIELEE
jgi:DNA-binding NarL/FixJ family response regulator